MRALKPTLLKNAEDRPGFHGFFLDGAFGFAKEAGKYWPIPLAAKHLAELKQHTQQVLSKYSNGC